jgi:hypothetical protein
VNDAGKEETKKPYPEGAVMAPEGNYVKRPNRFSYVKYDERSVELQEHFRVLCDAIDVGLLTMLPNSPEKTLAVRSLEVAYMWIGKAIRDAQVARGGDATHQPARGE